MADFISKVVDDRTKEPFLLCITRRVTPSSPASLGFTFAAAVVGPSPTSIEVAYICYAGEVNFQGYRLIQRSWLDVDG